MIEPGQIYRAADGSGTLIRIVRAPARDWLGMRVVVETVLADGRGVRRRSLLTSQLHMDGATETGKIRRGGYVVDLDHPLTTTETQ